MKLMSVALLTFSYCSIGFSAPAELSCQYKLRMPQDPIVGTGITVPPDQSAEDRLLSFSEKCIAKHSADKRLSDRQELLDACVNAEIKCG